VARRPEVASREKTFFNISHIIQLTPQELSAEPRNSASAEALAVVRRPKEASRETITEPLSPIP